MSFVYTVSVRFAYLALQRDGLEGEKKCLFLTGNRNMRLEFGLECSTSKFKIKDLSKRVHVKFC